MLLKKLCLDNPCVPNDLLGLLVMSAGVVV